MVACMEVKKISIIKVFKRNIMINLLMIILIIIFLTILLFSMIRYNYESRELINILGNQRELTQSMAKNATRVYALLDALEDNDFVGSREEVISKISDSQKKMNRDRNTFEKVFNSIKQGYVYTGTKKIGFKDAMTEISSEISGINSVWPEFSKSADIIANSKDISNEIRNAAVYINENNEELLDWSNLITVRIVNEAKNKSFINIGLLSVLLGAAFLILSISLLNLGRYIILPLDELYRSISQMSLTNGDLEKEFITESPLMEPITLEVSGVFKKLNKLVTLIQNMNENYSFNDILKFIYESFSTFIPYTYIGIALITEDREQLKASYAISSKKLPGLPENVLGKTVPIAETSLGRVIETGTPRIINDLEDYNSKRPYKEYNRTILDAGIRASITLPLKFNNKPVGIIFFSSDRKNVYRNEHANFLQTIANSIAIALKNTIFIEDLLYSSILALAKLAESRDEDTGDHLQRMKIYSRTIAQFLFEESKYKNQITHEFIENIEKFSPLHDIGKVGIRDGILLKPAKLTPEEFEDMKYHAVYGGQVLRAADENIIKNGKSLFRLGIEIAEGHHEKWNGTGYPHGISGEGIPLSARIVAVADVFDALTSRRPYKEPFSLEESYNIIMKGSGNHFDPEVIRVFEKNWDRIVELYMGFQLESLDNKKLKA
jgi:HD-GYP domain-containing protein (c-di-GMP phosphodiesterase class II)